MTTKEDVRSHYKLFHHIFLYITENCQLRCNHCYMGSRIEDGIDMPYKKVVKIMNYCRRLGAENITFVGGEPTLHQEFSNIIDCAVDLGFNKIYVDTNGLQINKLKLISPKKINYIRVSLDGPNEEIHDKIRGKTTFNKTIQSIKDLIRIGHSVAITSTVFQFSIHKALSLLPLADQLGVSLLNYHVFSEEGRGVAKPHLSIIPEDWINFYESLKAIKHKYKTSIWYPPAWATTENIQEYITQGYRGCLGCTLDRLSIFPNGKCYVCSVLFDTPYNFGTITDNEFILNKEKNEFEMFTKAIFNVSEPWLSGCPAERILEEQGARKNSDEYISICRCWKSQI